MSYSKSAMDIEIRFESFGSKVKIGGPLKENEILIIAALLYASKGDLSIPVGISYRDIQRFKKYKMDIFFTEFKSLCRDVAARRMYSKDRVCEISLLWFESYTMKGTWGIYMFNHSLAGNVNSLNYDDVEKSCYLSFKSI